jgi:hypothetical protein
MPESFSKDFNIFFKTAYILESIVGWCPPLLAHHQGQWAHECLFYKIWGIGPINTEKIVKNTENIQGGSGGRQNLK